MNKHTITLTVEVETSNDDRKYIETSIKRGIVRFLDSEPICLARPSDVNITFGTDRMINEKYTRESTDNDEYKYVWLDIMDGFSASWTETWPFNLSEEHMMGIYEIMERPSNVKLLKYKCLTDAGFEFVNKMKLK